MQKFFCIFSCISSENAVYCGPNEIDFGGTHIAMEHPTWNTLRSYGAVAGLACVMGLSYQLFVFPNAFAPAGINGLATMLQYLLHVSIGYLSLLINLPLILLAWKKVDPDSKFYINFTSGTNIVAGACCSASYFIGATLYYVMNSEYAPELKRSDRIKVIQTPRMPDLEKMRPFARDLLMCICSKDEGATIPELEVYMESSAQKINHHINSFVDSGLVIKEKVGRNVILRGTEQGRMFCSWIAENDN